MKKIATLGLVSAIVILVAGCYSTTKIQEWDAQGNLIKQTETSAPIIEQITASTKDKTVFVWNEGWIAAVRAEPSSENMFNFEVIAAKQNKGFLNINKDQQNMDKIAEIIKAAKNPESLSITPTGVSSTGK